MKIYLTPTAKIITLKTEDVVRTSNSTTDDNFINYLPTWSENFIDGGIDK